LYKIGICLQRKRKRDFASLVFFGCVAESTRGFHQPKAQGFHGAAGASGSVRRSVHRESSGRRGGSHHCSPTAPLSPQAKPVGKPPAIGDCVSTGGSKAGTRLLRRPLTARDRLGARPTSQARGTQPGCRGSISRRPRFMSLRRLPRAVRVAGRDFCLVFEGGAVC
jgi:hypothetical protein